MEKINTRFKAIFTGRMNNWQFFKIQLFLYLMNLLGTKTLGYIPQVYEKFGQLSAMAIKFVIVIASIYCIFLYVVSCAKRLHDINLTGYFAIIALPLLFIDELILLAWLINILLIWWPGSKAANKYGEIPK